MNKLEKHITAPINNEITKDLKSGDYVYISGTIYTARDAVYMVPDMYTYQVPYIQQEMLHTKECLKQCRKEKILLFL